ncbi:MAG: GxxExxY protein [Acidobacteria bacterium]|nr:GxxExxY protein [Acidobacteriota bacterium]MCB9399045.1 GxxExxY protein [Acidobacteriota bacterium]
MISPAPAKAVTIDLLTNRVIGCAIAVHRQLGPGLLASAYAHCLAHELALGDLFFERDKVLSVQYKGVQLDCGYRVDFLIENTLILELKAVERLSAMDQAQVMTYLKLTHLRTGLLINFNVPLLKDGIQRFVN